MLNRSLALAIFCAVATITAPALYAGQSEPPAITVKITADETIGKDGGVWRRDPFSGSEKPQKSQKSPGSRPSDVKLQTPPPAPLTITLQGIMSSDNRYHALVNGRVVKAGDRIDGIIIKNIDRYKIVVQRDNDKQTLDIYQGKMERGTK